MYLDSINDPSDVRKLSIPELDQLSDEIRNYIVDVISKRGGHLASSLGVVELTVALHYVFNSPRDKIIWDVGHQCYAHKIITGRRKEFASVRTFGGISGFPKINESVHDAYNSGHSSTSLSLALGEACARDMAGKKYKVVPVIGDGSLTGGMAFEALNQIGHLKKDVIIILNDNDHSISKNVGAISEYLTRIITGDFYNKLRVRAYRLLTKIPYGLHLYSFSSKMLSGLRGLLVPGLLFEEMGLRYFGPVDGHNIDAMVKLFSRIRYLGHGPKIVHVVTKKGKGYAPAEKNPEQYHGTAAFDPATGTALVQKKLGYSEIAGKTIAALAVEDNKIVAVTAAMKSGTGLDEFEKCVPNRLFDVGIAEQHAIAFSGALARGGLKPFVSIYSSFLQRAVDQLIHDIGSMNLPVKLLVDRAGIVGEDGETHHGLYDIGFIKSIPRFMYLAPANGEELRDMLYFAAAYNDGPVAIRFPRGSADRDDIAFDRANPFVASKIKVVKKGKDVSILALGDMVRHAEHAARILDAQGISVCVVNLLTIKPLDITGIEQCLSSIPHFITIENGYLSGGVGESILAELSPAFRGKFLFAAGFPDEFIPQGTMAELFSLYKLDAASIAERIASSIKPSL